MSTKMRKTKLRTLEMHTKYITSKKDPNFYENAQSIKEWKFWRIIPNDFPYDAISEVHDMAIPTRETQECSFDESQEWHETVFPYIKETYDMIIENMPHQQSQPQRIHYHLIKLKIV